MGSAAKSLPDKTISLEMGVTFARGTRPLVVADKGRSVTVGLLGDYPENGGEGVHIGNDMDVTDAALRALKEEVKGILSPSTSRRVRKKLKLSRREAGGILKVGESDFDKYERGLLEPSDPTSQLLRLWASMQNCWTSYAQRDDSGVRDRTRKKGRRTTAAHEVWRS